MTLNMQMRNVVRISLMSFLNDVFGLCGCVVTELGTDYIRAMLLVSGAIFPYSYILNFSMRAIF